MTVVNRNIIMNSLLMNQKSIENIDSRLSNLENSVYDVINNIGPGKGSDGYFIFQFGNLTIDGTHSKLMEEIPNEVMGVKYAPGSNAWLELTPDYSKYDFLIFVSISPTLGISNTNASISYAGSYKYLPKNNGFYMNVTEESPKYDDTLQITSTGYNNKNYVQLFYDAINLYIGDPSLLTTLIVYITPKE